MQSDDIKRAKQRLAMQAYRARKKADSGQTPPEKAFILTPAEAAYIAGFFDGEGMIRIEKSTSKGARGIRPYPVYYLYLQISNCNYEVLKWIKGLVGGCIVEVKIPTGRRHWRIVKKSNKAAILLKAILPYLIIKHEQVELALDFQKVQSEHKNRYEPNRIGPIPRTSEEIAFKEHCYVRISELKRL